MTMFTLPNFCRVCLKYDKNLIDLEHIENEPNETLMSKLQDCVSEVEWKVFKPLLCHPCIKRLNIAYSFKKQCVQSASMLKSYVALVKDTKKRESLDKDQTATQSNAYMMLPNQKYIKIVVGPQSQNTFQNVFLNVVPAPVIPPPLADLKNNKDTNQNVFLNINNTFQKYIPVAPAEQPLTLNQLLNDSKSEELSVEIDPKDFAVGDGCSSDNDEDSDNGIDDWDDVISSTQITSQLNGVKVESSPKVSLSNYVPILPKQSDEKMEFFNSGQHFLSSPSDFFCEPCQKTFSSSVLLRHHIKDFHLGKLPFKCEHCYMEFVVRSEYQSHGNLCMAKKFNESESDSLTLDDFKSPLISLVESNEIDDIQETTDLKCTICNRQFNSSSGLLRHKVRKHNQKSKRKYFIKGMKNARCDICNREFSTQSYMQLHRKLHLRDDIGYKCKVFSKDRYVKNESTDDKSEDAIEQNLDNHKEDESNKKADEMDEDASMDEVQVKEEIDIDDVKVEEESNSGSEEN